MATVATLTPQTFQDYTSGAPAQVRTELEEARAAADDAYDDMRDVMDSIEEYFGAEAPEMPESDVTYVTQDTELTTDVTAPDAPTDEFGSVTAPVAPTLYDMLLGVFMTMPTGTDFSYLEDVYTTRRTAELSALMISLEEKLQYDITNGSTGLDATVEAAIWARARDRSADAYEQESLKVDADCAARGFFLPTGASGGRQLEIAMENERALAQVNYEIMIKQAELAQANSHFVIQQSVALETQLMQHFHQLMNRMLEAEKAETDQSIKAFGAQVDAATTQNKGLLEEYNTAIAKYKADTEHEAAKMDVVVKKFEALVKAYDTEIKYEIAKMQWVIDEYKGKIQQETNRVELEIKEAELSLQGFLGNKNMRLEVLKAQANIASQIAASALSTIHAQVGWTFGQTLGQSQQTSFDQRISNEYSENATVTA